jgi:outer membrane receptor for ferrienterochelin and colicin
VEAAGIGLGPGRAGPVALRPGYAVDLDVLLSPGAYDLDPIDVTAEAMDGYLRAVGFYERQRSSRGYHLTRANIEQRLGAASDGAHLISQLPGVSITDGTPGSFGAALRISRACGGPPLIFVDGFRILTGLLGEGGGQPSYNFLTYVVQPEDVHAIEVYRSPSQIPPQFGGSESMCGVIVIWTSRGIRDAR